MRLLRNILALTPCGKPQAAHFAHVIELLQWLPGRLNFTSLEHYGGRSARTHARWFTRPFPFARLAVAALGAAHPRVPEGLGALLAMDASFVAKSGDETWGTGWFWSGMARAARWGLEVTLLAAVDVEEGGAYPLCARQSPGAVRSRRQACGTDTGRETAAETALALLGEAVEAGARDILGARWVAVDGGYASRPFVEGVRKLDLHTVGRLRRDAVLRFPYTGPHERRPGRKKQFDGCFDRRDPARLARTTLKKAKVDLYHGRLHSKTWQCLAAGGVRPAPRGRSADDGGRAPVQHRPGPGAGTDFPFSTAPASRLSLPSATPSSTWASTMARPARRPGSTFTSTLSSPPLFWARLQARLRAERPLGPFSLRNLQSRNLEEEIHKRIAAGSAAGRNASNSEGGRHRIPPERLWLRAPPPEMGPTGP